MRGSGHSSPSPAPEGQTTPSSLELRSRSRGMSLDWVLTTFRRDQPRPEPISVRNVSNPVLQSFPADLPFSLVDRHQAFISCGSDPSTPNLVSPAKAAHHGSPSVQKVRSVSPRARSQTFGGYLSVSDDSKLQLLLSDQFHTFVHPSHGHVPVPSVRKQIEDRQEGRRKRRPFQAKPIQTERGQQSPQDSPFNALQLPPPSRPPPLPPNQGRSAAQTKRQENRLDEREKAFPVEDACERSFHYKRLVQSQPFPQEILSKISEGPPKPACVPPPERLQTKTANMTALRPESLLPPAVGTKARAIQQAKEMEQFAAERAKRSGDEPPPYDFLELIGKGAYGRVFKGKNRTTNGLVAIKVIDIDKVDYEEMTSKNLTETLKEIDILQQVKASKARPYVNIIEEARTVHSELWIVSEYCSGGSVNTLMKPNMQRFKTGLEEKYIIPLARELALGLKYIHEAGVIHRDLKCNNILVDEEGRVQLCDFGVSGALEPENAKRSTIVGTPFWMPPEISKEWVKDADPNSRLRPNPILYGSEIDIWAYGCTIYEMATGFPPNHTTPFLQLPQADLPTLEGDQWSADLKDLISFVCQPHPGDRPSPDQILEHPYLADTDRMYPTESLVQLLEQYYLWERQGGSRVSLFNPFGAQAPDPLAPEPEEGDEDWTFSTTDEFEKQVAVHLPDPFTSENGNIVGINPPPADEDRWAKLQAGLREEQIERGKRRLDRVFNTDSTPYRNSISDSDPRRPPSDLILRDFNPGAPNRETVIDLDFAAPIVADVPSIDLGEVPTVKAHRLNRWMRDMDEEEEADKFDAGQTARRATKDWKFPSMTEEPDLDQVNRRTVDWKFPTISEKPNRKTMEWTFDMSMAEAKQEPLPSLSRLSRYRDKTELTVSNANMPAESNRRTRDFVFPMRDHEEGGSLSLQAEAHFRPSLRHAATEPLGTYDDYPSVNSAPESPIQTSMIDLDLANIDDYRPSTSGSTSTSAYTAGTEPPNGNPFDLEDQVHLSQTNNRASFHMKSQSEPNHAIPGLLTPQTYDEHGQPTNQDVHHPGLHARGVSSVSQVQPKLPSNNVGFSRQTRQQQYQPYDGWNHQEAYRIDESPPTSISPATSGEFDDETLDERWATIEKQAMAPPTRRQLSGFRSRRTASQDEEPRSDADDYSASEPHDDMPMPLSRVSLGPNGRPLVDFPIPRGPDPEALLGVDTDATVLGNALLKSTMELRDGLRTSRDLLRNMRMRETELSNEVSK